MRKYLPWILALSLLVNAYLLGSNIFQVSTAAGDANLEQLQSQLEEYKAEKERLEQETEMLRQKLESLQSAVEPGPEPSPDSGSLDTRVYGWYFKKRGGHAPPTTEPQYMQMLEGRGYFLGDTGKKEIYLTFDEGYENGYTGQILDTLRDNNVKAAFFVTGSYVEKNPALVKRMVEEGHIVGNHSDTHPSMPSLSNEEIKRELEAVEKQVHQLTGTKMSYFRPPRGEFNRRVLDVAHQEGYTTIFWSMAYQDWLTDRQPGKEVAFKHVTENIHNGAIILLHAVSKSNTEALDDIIKELKKMGYKFKSLDNLKAGN